MDYFKNIEVADLRGLQKRYKYWALKLHPDKNDSPRAQDDFKLMLNQYHARIHAFQNHETANEYREQTGMGSEDVQAAPPGGAAYSHYQGYGPNPLGAQFAAEQAAAEAAEDDENENHKTTNYRKRKMPRTYRKRTSVKRQRKGPGVLFNEQGQALSKKNYYYDKVTKDVRERPNFSRAGVDPIDKEGWDNTLFGYTGSTANKEQKLNRRLRGYSGKGMYGGQGKYGLGKIMNRARGYIGGAAKLAHTGIAAYRGIQGALGGGGIYGGQGAYVQNALMENGGTSMTVHEQNDETDTMVLTNREFIKEIYAPDNSGFNMENIECNPGLPGFAPKLAAIAANYQQYDLKQLIFEIVPLVSESNVNNGITGTIMAVWNYDTNTDLFDNKEDIMQSSGAVSGRIVDHLTCGVECDTGKTKDTEYFTRTCPVPLGRDADEYDHGKLIVATNNIPSSFYNQTIAELYVYYTVELRHFKPGTTRLNGQQRDEFLCVTNNTEHQVPGPQIAAKEVLRVQQSNLNGRLTGASAIGTSTWTYTFSSEINGFFEIRLYTESPGTQTFTNYNLTKTGNVETIPDLIPAGSGAGVDAHDDDLGYGFGSGSAGICVVHRIKVRSATSGVPNTCSISLTSPTSTGTVTSWGYQVIEMSQNHWQGRKLYTPVYINDATKERATL